MIIFVVENYLNNMIAYPNAKVNIGLNIINKRTDGYHDIQSIFYPVKNVTDIIEIKESKHFLFTNSGIQIPHDNICVKAYDLLKNVYNLPNVTMHLHKRIPICAGLGGGSSDAAFTLKIINQIFNLSLSNSELKSYALDLGADCPFFIDNTPKYVEGVGEKLTEIDLDLSDYTIKIFPSDIHISTAQAYSLVNSVRSSNNLIELIQQPITLWQDLINNDFEAPIFKLYSELDKKKQDLIEGGAIFSSMTGTGSALFGIFKG